MSVEFSSLKVLFEFENDRLVQTENGKSISHYRFVTSEIPCKKRRVRVLLNYTEVYEVHDPG